MKVGYQRRGKISHRKYSWKSSLHHYRKTGKFRNVAGGSGHRAGEAWGDAKNIDPNSPQRRYGKNSPSFDEGVWLSKQRRKETKAKMQEMAKKMK